MSYGYPDLRGGGAGPQGLSLGQTGEPRSRVRYFKVRTMQDFILLPRTLDVLLELSTGTRRLCESLSAVPRRRRRAPAGVAAVRVSRRRASRAHPRAGLTDDELRGCQGAHHRSGAGAEQRGRGRVRGKGGGDAAVKAAAHRLKERVTGSPALTGLPEEAKLYVALLAGSSAPESAVQGVASAFQSLREMGIPASLAAGAMALKGAKRKDTAEFLACVDLCISSQSH